MGSGETLILVNDTTDALHSHFCVKPLLIECAGWPIASCEE
jgi:hypothetical protein